MPPAPNIKVETPEAPEAPDANAETPEAPEAPEADAETLEKSSAPYIKWINFSPSISGFAKASPDRSRWTGMGARLWRLKSSIISGLIMDNGDALHYRFIHSQMLSKSSGR
jgi:hypothetical protein